MQSRQAVSEDILVHSERQISGIKKALDRLESRIKTYREYLAELSRGQDPVRDIEEVAITDGEVETIELLVLQLSEGLTGKAPKESEWEPMWSYCSRKEEKKEGFVQQNLEFFRWALVWIETTRTYLDFLDAAQPADHAAETAKQSELTSRSTQGRTISRTGGNADQSDTSMIGLGRYIGKIVWTPLPDGRLMELVEGFGFMDPNGLEWTVPPRTQVDGASIPQVLWSIVGSPFTGKYRDASVIHDYYCDVRVRPWTAVHRVFYDAMIVSGVSVSRAKLMYGAVYYGGPRWSDAARHNSNLQRPDIFLTVKHSPVALDMMKIIEVDGTTVDEFRRGGKAMPSEGKEAKLNLRDLERIIAEYDPTPDQIAAAIDTSTGVLDSFATKEKSLYFD